MESTDNTALIDQLKELKISNFAYSIQQTNIYLDNMQKNTSKKPKWILHKCCWSKQRRKSSVQTANFQSKDSRN